MGKLIKYEWRKQRTTRIIITACLLVFFLLFVIGLLTQEDTLVGISILVITFTGILGIFYVGIENMLILNRDLKTKQSYMLWMVPHSTYEILGAKIIAGIFQMMFVFLEFFITGAVTLTVSAAGEGSLGMLLRSLANIFHEITNSNINWGGVFGICLLILISWINIMVVGLLAIILTRTILLNNKFGGLIAVVVFFVINFLIEKLYTVLNHLIGMEPLIKLSSATAFDYLFYIIMIVLTFLLSGWIADKKLSV